MTAALDVTAGIWRGVGGAPGALDRVTVTGPTHVLPSVFPVTVAATATVAAATLAVAELWRLRRGPPDAAVAVDTRHTAFAVRSERLVRLVGQDLGDPRGPVGGDYATADGWVRLHALYPWHRAAALHALGLPADATPTGPDDTVGASPAPVPPTSSADVADADAGAARAAGVAGVADLAGVAGMGAPAGARSGVDRATVRAAVARWRAGALEDAVLRAGGCAAALRSRAAWRGSAQAAALAVRPLVSVMPLGPGDGDRPVGPTPGRPLAGLRVLDLTRVIAGPLAGRFLAAYGADVLRIDPPGRPDDRRLVLDTTVGKRCAHLDLRHPVDQARFEWLVRRADVVLCGYRPGALGDLGYDPLTLARLRPGLVVGTLSAYGDVGPWGARRGFDSLVQMVTGIADEGRRAAGADVPVPLPCQLLDHATGYLLAAGVLCGLARRTAAARGGGWLVQVALARTAGWLDGLGRGGALEIPDLPDALPGELAVELDGPLGRSRHVACPGLVVGAAPRWATGPSPLGADAASWA